MPKKRKRKKNHRQEILDVIGKDWISNEFERANIHKIEDAKAAVTTFENQLGITLLETPAHPHTGERIQYHV